MIDAFGVDRPDLVSKADSDYRRGEVTLHQEQSAVHARRSRRASGVSTLGFLGAVGAGGASSSLQATARERAEAKAPPPSEVGNTMHEMKVREGFARNMDHARKVGRRGGAAGLAVWGGGAVVSSHQAIKRERERNAAQAARRRMRAQEKVAKDVYGESSAVNILTAPGKLTRAATGGDLPAGGIVPPPKERKKITQPWKNAQSGRQGQGGPMVIGAAADDVAKSHHNDTITGPLHTQRRREGRLRKLDTKAEPVGKYLRTANQ